MLCFIIRICIAFEIANVVNIRILYQDDSIVEIAIRIGVTQYKIILAYHRNERLHNNRFTKMTLTKIKLFQDLHENTLTMYTVLIS